MWVLLQDTQSDLEETGDGVHETFTREDLRVPLCLDLDSEECAIRHWRFPVPTADAVGVCLTCRPLDDYRDGSSKHSRCLLNIADACSLKRMPAHQRMPAAMQMPAIADARRKRRSLMDRIIHTCWPECSPATAPHPIPGHFPASGCTNTHSSELYGAGWLKILLDDAYRALVPNPLTYLQVAPQWMDGTVPPYAALREFHNLSSTRAVPTWWTDLHLVGMALPVPVLLDVSAFPTPRVSPTSPQ
ncbi:hypothetical protein NUW54_g8464 [Trametes sanguinea]|uniref:Uncharacterized protein n=1 Tax=Trametes sanguinea TaxID=158606 RepID=A0ACC1PEU2_9APHY|nr:hypothetical protein NUW54_g8464 [Trametes sanguinea]